MFLEGWTERLNLQVSGGYCLATSTDCFCCIQNNVDLKIEAKQDFSTLSHEQTVCVCVYVLIVAAGGLEFLPPSRTAVAPVSCVRGTMMISRLLIFKVSPDNHEHVPRLQPRHSSSPLRHKTRTYIREAGMLHKCTVINVSASWLPRPISEISRRRLKDTLIQR